MKKIPAVTLMLLLSFQINQATNNWDTWYEAHGKNQTPDYEATIAFCKRLADASAIISYQVIGQSHQLRDIPLLILDSEGNSDPQAIRSSGKTILLVQAAIHAGEPVGKDAGLMLFRDIAINGQYAKLLQNVSILFIPIMNPDGHARFGPYNRINQNGPQQMGWRTNALNLNLNRDYLKLDTWEMQAFAKLWNDWQPDFFIDTHSTNGGDYQYTMTYMLETMGNMDPMITQWCLEGFIPSWYEYMELSGHPVFPYVTYRSWHDPKSGLVSRTSPPALSNGYAATRNRPGLLLEAHMLKPYEMRVESTYHTILFVLKHLNEQGSELRELILTADHLNATTTWRKDPFPLDFSLTQDSIMVDFKGVVYEKKPSSLTGNNWFIYDNTQPLTYQIPWFSKQQISKQVMLPDAYVIPVQWKDIADRLILHGVSIRSIPSDTTLKIESYRFEQVSLSPSVSEGRQTVRYISVPIKETRVFPAGSYMVNMNQPLARLIAHALEPDAPSSYVSWGLFNPIFQRTEYFESYVMEAMAREMLAKDPDLEKRFLDKRAADSTFTGNAVLNWFYEQTPYHDSEFRKYPVGRVFNQ